MLIALWQNRSRQACFSGAWWKAWAKRVLQLPSALKQSVYQLDLRYRGAKISPETFFSDARLITGELSLLTIGCASFIGRAEISVHATLVIGTNVCINDGAKLLTASHDVTDPAWKTTSAPIYLEDYCWICTNALVLPGVRIGRGAVVGAGAVVTKDVPAYAIAAGNPARIVDDRRSRDLGYNPISRLALFNAWCD